MGITVLKQEGTLRLITFGEPPCFRVETVWGHLFMGTTYNTLTEAEQDYQRSLARAKEKSGQKKVGRNV